MLISPSSQSFFPPPDLHAQGLPSFSTVASLPTRRNPRKPFLFMHLLHNLRTPRGWGRRHRTLYPVSHPASTILFGIRTSEKHACKPHGIRTSKAQHLKSFRIRTYKKTGRGVATLNRRHPSSDQHRTPQLPCPRGFRVQRLPRPGRGVSALSFSVLFNSSTFDFQPPAPTPSAGSAYRCRLSAPSLPPVAPTVLPLLHSLSHGGSHLELFRQPQPSGRTHSAVPKSSVSLTHHKMKASKTCSSDSWQQQRWRFCFVRQPHPFARKK
jgi:hypothetical protein